MVLWSCANRLGKNVRGTELAAAEGTHPFWRGSDAGRLLGSDGEREPARPKPKPMLQAVVLLVLLLVQEVTGEASPEVAKPVFDFAFSFLVVHLEAEDRVSDCAKGALLKGESCGESASRSGPLA